MSKVGTEKYSIAGRSSVSKDWDIPVYFTKKDGFYCGVPKLVTSLDSSKTKIPGSDYNNAVAETRKYCDEIFMKGFSCKKVILYYIKLATDSKYANSDSVKERNGYGDSFAIINHPFFSMNGSPQEQIRRCIKFDFRVLYMVTVGTRVYISHIPVSSVSAIGPNCSRWHWSEQGGYSHYDWAGWEYMDHTPEFEEWFTKTNDSLGALLGRIADFFGDKKEHLMKSIEKSSGGLFIEYKNDSNAKK